MIVQLLSFGNRSIGNTLLQIFGLYVKKIYVKENTSLTLQEFRVFLEQFARGEKLDSLLCNRIKSDWWNFVDQRSFFKPIKTEQLSGKCISPEMIPSQPGVYGIFIHHVTSDFPLCFYVGISTIDVRSRIKTHLGTDIKKNYRSAFGSLVNADEIFICSSTVPDLGGNNSNRQELELLEHCLTVILRPRFLLLAAMNA